METVMMGKPHRRLNRNQMSIASIAERPGRPGTQRNKATKRPAWSMEERAPKTLRGGKTNLGVRREQEAPAKWAGEGKGMSLQYTEHYATRLRIVRVGAWNIRAERGTRCGGGRPT